MQYLRCALFTFHCSMHFRGYTALFLQDLDIHYSSALTLEYRITDPLRKLEKNNHFQLYKLIESLKAIHFCPRPFSHYLAREPERKLKRVRFNDFCYTVCVSIRTVRNAAAGARSINVLCACAGIVSIRR